MDNPKHPIPLDYKTPEKSERVTAGMIIWRVIAGMCGMFGLIVALIFTFSAIGVLADSLSKEQPSKEIVSILALCFFALIAWIFTIRWLKYAILGGKPRKTELIFKGRNEHINYE